VSNTIVSIGVCGYKGTRKGGAKKGLSGGVYHAGTRVAAFGGGRESETGIRLYKQREGGPWHVGVQ